MFGELGDGNKSDGDSILYFYPDLCTVICGTYKSGAFIKGKGNFK